MLNPRARLPHGAGSRTDGIWTSLGPVVLLALYERRDLIEGTHDLWATVTFRHSAVKIEA